MEILFVLIYLVFGVLSLILFFKVWGMCNNIKRILQLYENQLSKNESASRCTHTEDSNLQGFKIGDKVVILGNGKVGVVHKIEDGKYGCDSVDGKKYLGLYCFNELNKF